MAELDEDITKVPSGTLIYDAQDYIRKCSFWEKLRDYEKVNGKIRPSFVIPDISVALEEYNEKWTSIIAKFSNDTTFHLASMQYLRERHIELLSQIIDEEGIPKKDILEEALGSIKSVVKGNKFNVGPFCFVLTDSPAGITKIKNTYVRVVYFPVLIEDEKGREVIDYITLAKAGRDQMLSFVKDFDEVSPFIDAISAIIYESMKLNNMKKQNE